MAQTKYGHEESSKETANRIEELKEKYDISDNDEDVDSQEMEEDCEEEENNVDFELILESGWKLRKDSHSRLENWEVIFQSGNFE